jgi:hypothetical protein
MLKLSHRAKRMIEHFSINNVSKSIIDELKDFLSLCESLTPSTKPRYHKLEEWSNPVNEFTSTMLKKHDFINGGKEQNPNARFWWILQGLINSALTTSIHIDIKTEVSKHHASAHERNEALKLELKSIIEALQND